MFNSLNNPRETEEQKRRRMNDAQMQTPYDPGQPQMTPRQMVEQTWDRSAAEQTAKEKELEPMKNMSAHDALEFIWNKQEEKRNENIPFHQQKRQEKPLFQKLADTAAKAVKWLPEYKTLEMAKQEMDRINKGGYDNYAHRLGMCRVGQLTSVTWPYSPAIGMGLGILKEGKDLIDKSYYGNMPLDEALSDTLKDMENNFEGLSYGLNNPDRDCREWLKDLDYRRNQWREQKR